MKIRDVPQSGHLGTFVSYKTRYGQFRRAYVVPADPKSAAQLLRRARMGRVAARWRTLADIQRAAWNADVNSSTDRIMSVLLSRKDF